MARDDPSYEHYNYDQLQGGDKNYKACNCFLCRDWAEKSTVWGNQELICEGHGNVCRCPDCLERIKIRTAMIASDVRRTIYSEMSFITRDEKFRDNVLAWLLNFLRTTSKGDAWFAFKAEGHTLDWWLQKWHIETHLRAIPRRRRKKKKGVALG